MKLKHLLSQVLFLLAILVTSNLAMAQTITGKVTDNETGEVLIGASVIVVGTTAGAMTDANGFYSVSIPDGATTLEFSYTGYATKEVEINGRTVINPSLIPSTITQELVVIGYGTTKKSHITGSISSVSKNRLKRTHSRQPRNNESYDKIVANKFIETKKENVSTFSVDVDRSSYSNVRRFLTQNEELPPADAVRTEELINYFNYDYPQPTGEHPLSITTEMTACPWNKNNRLALVGLQGKMVNTENIPPSNLVFLIDVSGSMGQANKLPLLKESFRMLVDRMRPEDRVAIVVYASAEGIALNSTLGTEKEKIKSALNNLRSGGSTAGSAGIQLAYEVAQENFIEGGTNRVILATDGDFNVGPSSDKELVRLIESKRDENIFLSVLGFGMGNYKDSKMEKLADNGNGNYAYIDNLDEAKKVFGSWNILAELLFFRQTACHETSWAND